MSRKEDQDEDGNWEDGFEDNTQHLEIRDRGETCQLRQGPLAG